MFPFYILLDMSEIGCTCGCFHAGVNDVIHEVVSLDRCLMLNFLEAVVGVFNLLVVWVSCLVD